MQWFRTGSLRIKTEHSRGVLYSDGLNFQFGSERQSEDEAPESVDWWGFAKEVDEWAGWEVRWLQACNNILRNTDGKVLKTIKKTIWLQNATHMRMIWVMALTWLLPRAALKPISTSHSRPFYSGRSHSAGEALELEHKYTRCSFRATEEAAKVALPRKWLIS